MGGKVEVMSSNSDTTDYFTTAATSQIDGNIAVNLGDGNNVMSVSHTSGTQMIQLVGGLDAFDDGNIELFPLSVKNL